MDIGRRTDPSAGVSTLLSPSTQYCPAVNHGRFLGSLSGWIRKIESASVRSTRSASVALYCSGLAIGGTLDCTAPGGDPARRGSIPPANRPDRPGEALSGRRGIERRQVNGLVGDLLVLGVFQQVPDEIQAAPPLVVEVDHGPRGVWRMRRPKHRVPRPTVLPIARAGLQIHRRELPSLQGVRGPLRESLLLMCLVGRQPVLTDLDAV